MVTDILQENATGRNLAPNTIDTPFEFEEIRAKFEKAKAEGTRILLETNELNLAYSVVMEIEYIGTRWAMGKVRYHQVEGDVYVPYTVHYADLYTGDHPRSTSKTTKIIFEGVNPFGTRLGEGSTED